MNENESNDFYFKVQKEVTEWTKKYIKSLPNITPEERKELLKMTDNLQIDNIDKINTKIQNMNNISEHNKRRFLAYTSKKEWFDWKPGESYRFFHGRLWIRMMPISIEDWLTDDMLEEFYKEEPPEERASYELQKYMLQHPRKANNITQEEKDEIYKKYLKKYTKEWEEKQAAEEAIIKKNLKEKKIEPEYEQLSIFNITPISNQRNNETKGSEHSMLKKEILPVLNIKKQYMNNSKIARIISTKQISIDDNARKLEISIHDNIINLVDLWTDPNIELSQQVTQFDMAVMDAAYTIMNSGLMILTAEWIAKVLSGNKEQKITPQKIGAIRKSIDKLRNIHIKINCKDELNSRRDTKGKIDTFIYESYLLPLEKITAKYEANGKEIIAYPILSKPALYKYAELVHQIIDVPIELLETQEYFNDTDEAILIKRYVIKRVAQIIKKNNLNSNRISYLWYENNNDIRGLYAELGYKPDDSEKWRTKTKAMINKIVKNTLQSLQDKNFIKDFKEYRADGTNNPASPIMGYEIYY